MSWGRLLPMLMISACAGADRIAPEELELRDLLGISPDVAMTWTADQRAGARHVLEAGMHDASAAASAPFDRSLATALATADAERAKHHEGALGVVSLDIVGGDLHATTRTATLAPRATAPIELRLAGWTDKAWGELPARGLDVLATIASDAGHRGGPLVVTPARQLAVIAGYVPATATDPARLVVNPIVLAALEPTAATPVVMARNALGADTATPVIVARTALAPGTGTPVTVARTALAPDTGNPYAFYSSVAECASAQRGRCEACLPNLTCTPVTGSGDGNTECAQFASGDSHGYSSICIDLALAIDSVDSCLAASAPACPRDRHAAEQLSSLDNNTDFIDDATCATALDACLDSIFGGATPTTPPHDTSPSCADATCNDTPSCDLGDASCDGSCDGGGDPGSSDGCSGDSSGGDCSGDSGGSCSGDSGGDCGGGGGGDCSGGGGDCSGGGGDCGGGGGDCNAAGHHPRHGGGSGAALLWACLPLPFARLVRRRAVRRKASEACA